MEIEEEHHEGGEGEENFERELGEEEENYGFQPFENDEEKEKKKEQDMSPAAQQLRIQINRLICRYPQLTPRSSSHTIETLNRYSLEQLQNIYDNCINDLQSVRGTPTSEMVINVTGSLVERYSSLRGFRERCLTDTELNRDIEAEMISLLYYCGNKLQIAFRFANNAFKCYFDLEDAPNKPPEEPESVKKIQKGIKSIFDEQEDKRKRDEEESDGESLPRSPPKKRKKKHGGVGENTTSV